MRRLTRFPRANAVVAVAAAAACGRRQINTDEGPPGGVKKSFTIGADRPGVSRGSAEGGNIIRVRSDTKTASLSGWLTTRLRESKESLTMTTIGMMGLNQVIKAVSVAQELLAEEGLLHCRATKTETVTDRGGPASYFAIYVVMRPPSENMEHQNVAPNRVGAASHGTAILQICESAQKLGQTCVLSVAGAESVQKAVIAISFLNKNTEFLPMLVKNEEGEYTAIHLKILPLPGSPKVVFVSKFTKPLKLAGFLRHVFRDDRGSKVVKVIASVDSHEALRTAAKACEHATDFLEQDRIPLTMSLEMTEDDEALSAGSFVFTLTRELAKEETALKVTVGLGNLSVGRVVQQLRAGLETGRLIHLRSTLQGVPTALEALSTINHDTPISFYSRPKDVGYGPQNQKVSSPQMDRFFLELMVERVVVPETIDHKSGSEASLLRAVKTHGRFHYLLKDIERLPGALVALTNGTAANVGKHSLRIVPRPSGIGISFEVNVEQHDPATTRPNRDISRHVKYHDGTTALTKRLAALQEEGGAFNVSAGNRVQMMQLLRAVAKNAMSFYIIPPARSESFRNLQIHIPKREAGPETPEDVEAATDQASPDGAEDMSLRDLVTNA